MSEDRGISYSLSFIGYWLIVEDASARLFKKIVIGEKTLVTKTRNYRKHETLYTCPLSCFLSFVLS
jgi:hypothetical protein